MENWEKQQADEIARTIVAALKGEGPAVVCEAIQSLALEAGWKPQQEHVPGEATARQKKIEELEGTVGLLMLKGKDLYDRLYLVKEALCSTCTDRLSHHFEDVKADDPKIILPN